MPNKVLLVDDESLILKALERLLKRYGYKVLTAESGVQALELMHQTPCQVVISDFRMPEMTGSQLLKQIDQLYPQTVCMVLSGYADFNAVIELLNSGVAFRYLQKPWDDEKLIAEVEAAFEKYHASRSLQIRNQFLISCSEPIIEVQSDGMISRVNAAAENFLKLAGISLDKTAIDQVFYDLEPLIHQHIQQKTESFIVQIRGRQVEFQLQKVDAHFSLLKLQPLQAVPDLAVGTVNLPSVLDQGELIKELELGLLRGEPFAAVSLQLRDYHLITSVLGTRDAEELFDEVAAALLDAVAMQGRLAYLANEQFILVFKHYQSESELHQKLMGVLSSVEQLQIQRRKLFQLNFNVAYVVAPQDGSSARTLFNNLLFTGRLAGVSKHQFFMRYNEAVSAHSKQRFQLSEALYRAVDNNELSIVLQPKWDVSSGNMVSAEVLCRWQHPEFGRVSPATFITLAEQDGQIFELGRWVIRNTCALLAKWRAKHQPLLPLAINVSAIQLHNPEFMTELISLLQHYQLTPDLIELELTESALMSDFSMLCQQLTKLNQAGFSISIDDFGTGYSSLAYLSRLPAQVLKLDKSLIDDLESSLSTQTMLQNIVRMIHELGKVVVVEGVETAEQLHILKANGCDQAQGFYLSEPVTENVFEVLLQRQEGA